MSLISVQQKNYDTNQIHEKNMETGLPHAPPPSRDLLKWVQYCFHRNVGSSRYSWRPSVRKIFVETREFRMIFLMHLEPLLTVCDITLLSPMTNLCCELNHVYSFSSLSNDCGTNGK